MDKHFPVEPFEYATEGEDEDERERDHRRDHNRYVWRTPPVANVSTSRWRPASAWQKSAWQNPAQRNARWGNATLRKSAYPPYSGYPRYSGYPSSGRYPGNDARRQRRYPDGRYPYLPFPSPVGCSCDQADSTTEPQPVGPIAADGRPPAPAATAAAGTGPAGDGAGTGATDGELDRWGPSWDQPAQGFRDRKRRRAAERGYHEVPLQRAFDRPTLPLHFDAEAQAANVSPGAAPRLGTLTVVATGRHRFTYAFTPDDLVWTARFIVGEAGGADNLGNAAVIWAMFNRYALFTHSHYSTFHGFLRAYSTPLQRVLNSPGAARRHMTDPGFVKAGDTYPGTSIPRGQLRRFLALQARPWDQLPPAARGLALRALQGGVGNPIGNATEFASTAVYFHDHHGKHARLDTATWRRFTEQYAATKRWKWIGDVPGLDQRDNAFFLDHRVAGLPAGAVRISI